MAATMTNRVRNFAQDEDGALIVLALIFFLLMTMMGGVAIDIIKYGKV